MDGGIADEVAATFGLGAVAGPPVLATRGANGFIWMVTTDRGRWAVKRLQPWIADEPRPYDVDVQLAALDAGIRLPRPVLTSDGTAVVDRTRVYEWVDLGEQVALPVDDDRAAEAGSILGRLHALAMTSPSEIDPWYTTPPGRERWEDLARRGQTARARWADELAGEIEFLVELGSQRSRPPNLPVITCHCDFAPGNVLPALEDGRLVVLDWENAGPLGADAELAETIVLWCADGERADLVVARVLLGSYERVTGTTPMLRPSSFDMAVVTHLNYLAVNLDHSIDPAHAGEFVDRWIDRLAPRNLRRRLVGIDALIEAFAT